MASRSQASTPSRPRRPARAPAPAPVAPPEQPEPADDARDDIPDDAASAIARFGENASKVRLYRWNDELGEYAYLATVTAADFDEDRVAKRFGGGKYRGNVMDGGNRYVGSISPFLIAGDVKREVPDVVGRVEVGLEERIATIVERVVKSMQPAAPAAPAVAPVDPLAMVERVASVLSKVQRPEASAGMGVVETLNLMEQARTNGIELGKQLAAKEPGDSDLSRLISDFGVPLIGLVQRDVQTREEMARRAPAALPATTFQAPAPAPSPAPAPVPADYPEGFAFLAALRPYAARIAPYARMNADPDDIAGFALLHMDAGLQEQMAAAAEREDFTNVVVAHVPELREWDGWFRQVVDAVRDRLTEDDDEEEAQHVA